MMGPDLQQPKPGCTEEETGHSKSAETFAVDVVVLDPKNKQPLLVSSVSANWESPVASQGNWRVPWSPSSAKKKVPSSVPLGHTSADMKG